MSLITVLGASGFIGSHLVETLRQRKINHQAPVRTENLKERNLGVVIYCVGLTADFRSKPFETVTAHVCKLLDTIKECEFDSLIYLSSTRLYGFSSEIASEGDSFKVNTQDSNDLYNISKAMGESLALASRDNVTIVRLSNVYGADQTSDNFLSEIVKAALHDGKIVLRTSLDSEKDYVDVNGVANLLIDMATKGCRERVYNVASGRNCSNKEITEAIASLTDCEIELAPNAPRICFPRIDISKIRDEFAFASANVLEDMEAVVNFYRRGAKES
jgi:NAD dependent epimerase/dehydratase family.